MDFFCLSWKFSNPFKEPKPVARTTFLDVAAFTVFESLKAVDIHCPFFNASKAIVLIHDLVCSVYSNKKAFAELATEAITTLNAMDKEVTNAKQAGRELSGSQKTRINEFTEIIWNIHSLVAEHIGRSLFDRVFRSNKDAATISSFQRKLAKAQGDFMTCSMISVESKLDDSVSILDQVIQNQIRSQSLLPPIRKRVKRKVETSNELKPEHTLCSTTSSTNSRLSSQPRGSTVMTNSGKGVFNNVGGSQYNNGTNIGTARTFRPRMNPMGSTDGAFKVGAMRVGRGAGACVGSGAGLGARFSGDHSVRYSGRKDATSRKPCAVNYFDSADIDIYGISPSLQELKDEDEQYEEGDAEGEEEGNEDEGNYEEAEEEKEEEDGSSSEDEEDRLD